MDLDCINVTRERIKEFVRVLYFRCHIVKHFLSNVNPQIHPNHLSWLKEARELKKRKKTDPKERQRQRRDSLWICMCQQNQINVNSCMFKKMRRFLSANIRGFVTILEVHKGDVFEKHFLCGIAPYICKMLSTAI